MIYILNIYILYYIILYLHTYIIYDTYILLAKPPGAINFVVPNFCFPF